MVFQIRNKPEKPERKEIIDSFGILEFPASKIRADEVWQYVQKQVQECLTNHSYYYIARGLTLADYTIYLVESGDWDDRHIDIQGHRKETDAEYNVRFQAYEKKLAEYYKWYEINKDKIAAELALREKRDQDVKAKRIHDLERELKKLRG